MSRPIAMLPITMLFAAPHRLAFLTGSLSLTGLAAWWLLHLADLHFGPLDLPRPLDLPQGTLPAALLHGPAMLYLLFPPFVFGFLLTVFPRWMGYPDLGRAAFGPVSALLALGALAAQAGLWSGHDGTLAAGFALTGLGWATGLAVLGRVAWRNTRDGHAFCPHAWSALAGLGLGLAGLGLATCFIVYGDPRAWLIANRIGIGGFLLPVFLTVMHRMLPFFAGNVVPGYVRWRPDWLLIALWGLLLARLAGELGRPVPAIAPLIAPLVILANAALALLTGAMAWKWWPRRPGFTQLPGLLNVLLLGLGWAPIGFALSALAECGAPLGRAPDHALAMGFAASLLVGMVTRVTQGHSGRPLAMTATAWIAFGALQLATLGRIAAALRLEDGTLLVLTGGVFLLGLAPWTLRHAAIYLGPRRDGRPG